MNLGTDRGRVSATMALPPAASLSDNVGVASIVIEFSGSLYDPTDSIVLTLVQSPHTLHYVSQDAAGNTARCTVNVTVSGKF